MDNEFENIDFDRLRKRLVSREFVKGLITGSFSDAGNCINASEANPEQLIAIARRYNINLENYKKS